MSGRMWSCRRAHHRSRLSPRCVWVQPHCRHRTVSRVIDLVNAYAGQAPAAAFVLDGCNGRSGPAMRSGERDERGEGARPQRRTNVDINRELRGGRAERRTGVDVNVDRGRDVDRSGRRTRVDMEVDRRRRSGRDVDIDVRRGYGYGSSRDYGYRSSCEQLLQRYRSCPSDGMAALLTERRPSPCSTCLPGAVSWPRLYR